MLLEGCRYARGGAFNEKTKRCLSLSQGLYRQQYFYGRSHVVSFHSASVRILYFPLTYTPGDGRTLRRNVASFWYQSRRNTCGPRLFTRQHPLSSSTYGLLPTD